MGIKKPSFKIKKIMQIGALDLTGSLIFAEKANRHQDYQCIECKEKVRLRRGMHRQAHYYHLQPNRVCKQHGKGMPHLMLQHFLKNILPDEEAEMECQFPSIGRIADVAWHPKRLIYEIQCSPISALEVKERNNSYASIGYQVVWIFHDSRYNQHRLSAAEMFLMDQPHYFTDMNECGEGKIYDQPAIITKGKRVSRLPALPIDPTSPKLLNKQELKRCRKLPFVLKNRANDWPFIFLGDTIDSCLSDEEYKLSLWFKEMTQTEKTQAFSSFVKYPINFLHRWIAQPYQAVLKLILERACR
jgi:competence protein CoiA